MDYGLETINDIYLPIRSHLAAQLLAGSITEIILQQKGTFTFTDLVTKTMEEG